MPPIDEDTLSSLELILSDEQPSALQSVLFDEKPKSEEVPVTTPPEQTSTPDLQWNRQTAFQGNVDKILDAEVRDPVTKDKAPPDEMQEEEHGFWHNMAGQSVKMYNQLWGGGVQYMGGLIQGESRETKKKKLIAAGMDDAAAETFLSSLIVSGQRPEEMQNLGKKITEIGEANQKDYEERVKSGETIKPDEPTLKRPLTTVLPMAIPQLGAAAITLGVTKNPITAGASLLPSGAASRMEQAKSLGLKDDEATDFASRGVVVDALMNALPIHFLEKVPGFGKYLEEAATSTKMSDRLVSTTSRALQTTAATGVSEGATQAADNQKLRDLGANVNYDDGVLEASAMGAITGFGIHSVVEGTALTSEALEAREKRIAKEKLGLAREKLMEHEVDVQKEHMKFAALDAMEKDQLRKAQETALNDMLKNQPLENPQTTELLGDIGQRVQNNPTIDDDNFAANNFIEGTTEPLPEPIHFSTVYETLAQPILTTHLDEDGLLTGSTEPLKNLQTIKGPDRNLHTWDTPVLPTMQARSLEDSQVALMIAKGSVEKAQQRLAEPNQSSEQLLVNQQWLAAAQSSLKALTDKLNEEQVKFETLKPEEPRFWKYINTMAEQALKFYPRGSKLIIQPLLEGSNMGETGVGKLGLKSTLKDLSEDTVAQVIHVNPFALIPEDGTSAPNWARTHATFWHEVGHGVLGAIAEQLPDSAKMLLANEYRKQLAKAFEGKTWGQWALEFFGPDRAARTVEEYKSKPAKESNALLGIKSDQYLDIARMPAEEFLARMATRGRAKSLEEMKKVQGKRFSFGEYQHYLMSYPEWIAEQTSKYMAVGKSAEPLMEEGLKAAFDEFQNASTKIYGSDALLMSHFQGVEAMLQWMASKNAYEKKWLTFQGQAIHFLDLADKIKPQDFNPSSEVLLRQAGAVRETLYRGRLLGSRVFSQKLTAKEIFFGIKSFRGKTAADNMQGKLDNYSRWKNNVQTLLQTCAENPHVPGLTMPTRKGGRAGVVVMEAYARKKQQLNMFYDSLLSGLKYGKRDTDTATRLAMQVSLKSMELGRKLTEQEKLQVAQKHGLVLTENVMDKYRTMEKFLMAPVDQLQVILEGNIRRRLAEFPVRRDMELKALKERLEAAKAQDYFPLSRFGDYLVRVVAAQDTVVDGTKFKEGDTIVAEAWETQSEADAAAAFLGAHPKYAGHGVQTRLMSPEQRMFRGIPPAFLTEIKEYIPAEHQGDLAVALSRAAPGDGYMKRWTKRRGVEGFSRNGYRALQSYYISFNHFLARAEFHDEFVEAVGEIEQSVQDMLKSNKSVDVTKRQLMADMLKGHIDYVMNPKNEWDAISAAAFQWHLAWIPAKMFLNWTQIPAVTYPYLAQRYGDAAALTHLTKAQTHAFKGMYKHLSPSEKAMMQVLEEDGCLNNTQASALIGSQHSQLLHRMLPSASLADAAYDTLSKIGEVGGWMFQHSEMYTRRIAAIAAYRLELAALMREDAASGKKMTPLRRANREAQAMQAAKEAVQASLFEYSQFNRPKFMRGSMKPLLVFMTYTQHMLEFYAHDPARGRALVIAMGLAGLTGLPFAEDIMELTTWLSRQLNKHYGKEVFPADTKNWLQKELEGIVCKLGGEDTEGILTDLLMRGASSYGFGLPWLAERAGIPLSYFDIHNSLSMGQIIPGVSAINAPDAESFIAKAAEDIGGAGMTMPFSMLKAGYDTSGNEIRQWQQLAPASIRNPLTAIDAYMKKGLESKTGAQLVEFDPNSIQHKTELIMMGLGMPSSRVNMARNRAWAARSETAYYVGRKQLLLHAVATAHRERDKEGEADARHAIRRFNGDLPYPAFKITGMDIARAQQSLKKKVKAEESGKPTNKDAKKIYKDINAVYPEPDVLNNGGDKAPPPLF